MKIDAFASPDTVKSARLWRYPLGFLLVAALWAGGLTFLLKPGTPMASGLPRAARIGLVTLPPLLLVGGLFLYARRPSVRKQEREQEEQLAVQQQAERDRQEEEARQAALLVHKRFHLEVLSLGVAAGSLKQSQLCDALRSGKAPDRVLLEDPGEVEEMERAAIVREVEVLSEVLGWLTDEWAIPTFLAGPPLANPKVASFLEGNLVEAAQFAEVPGCPLKVVEYLHCDAPDLILETIFEFFEMHKSVPAVLLLAEDGEVLRDYLRPEASQSLLEDGNRSPQPVLGSMVAFVLGRKDRLEPMRYLVPQDTSLESVMKPFWEKEQPRRSAKAFVASSWVSQAWSSGLQESFSQLPVLGHLHRPQFVTFETMGEASRLKAFRDAWSVLWESRANEEKLTSLYFDHGTPEGGGRLMPLCLVLKDFDPDWDAFVQGVDLHHGFGDTGSNRAFLGLALAVLAVQKHGGMGVSVNLRHEGQAGLFMVTDVQEKQRSDSE